MLLEANPVFDSAAAHRVQCAETDIIDWAEQKNNRSDNKLLGRLN